MRPDFDRSLNDRIRDTLKARGLPSRRLALAGGATPRTNEEACDAGVLIYDVVASFPPADGARWMARVVSQAAEHRAAIEHELMGRSGYSDLLRTLKALDRPRFERFIDYYVLIENGAPAAAERSASAVLSEFRSNAVASLSKGSKDAVLDYVRARHDVVQRLQQQPAACVEYLVRFRNSSDLKGVSDAVVRSYTSSVRLTASAHSGDAAAPSRPGEAKSLRRAVSQQVAPPDLGKAVEAEGFYAVASDQERCRLAEAELAAIQAAPAEQRPTLMAALEKRLGA